VISVEIEQSLPSLRSEVLDVVGFIKDHIFPPFTLEDLLIVDDKLIRGDTYMPSILFIPTFSFLFTLFRIAVVGENFEAGSPFLELHFPVEDDTRGYDNEMWTPNMFLTCKMCNESNCLDCFPKVSSS